MAKKNMIGKKIKIEDGTDYEIIDRVKYSRWNDVAPRTHYIGADEDGNIAVICPSKIVKLVGVIAILIYLFH